MPAEMNLRDGGLLRVEGPHSPLTSAPPPVALVNADEVARPEGRLRLPCPQVGDPSCGKGRRTPTPAKKQEGRDR